MATNSNKHDNFMLLENGDLGTQKVSSEDVDLLFNISRHENQQFIPNESGHDNICQQFELRVFSTEATALMDEQLNCALPGSKSSDEGDEGFASTDESLSESLSASSDIHADAVPLDGYKSSIQQPGNRNVALVRPDYIIYQGRYSIESVLLFSKNNLKLEDTATHGDPGKSSFEWEIEDIVDIQSQWSQMLGMTMIKLHVMLKGAEDCLVEEIQFAVADQNWPNKQEEIMSLDVRYKARWNVVVNTETERDEHAVAETYGESIWRKSYFPNFVEFIDEVTFPKDEPDAVSITKTDVDMLQPESFVNDTIIDFYIKYLKNQMTLEKRNKIHFFNSFFFRKLIDLDKDQSSSFESKAAFHRVRKWTRKVNVFEKDYVFIPVNYGYHWSLILICHPGKVTKFEDEDMETSSELPCILHMDSMKGGHTVLKNIVQSYLWEEWRERNKDISEHMSQKFFNLRFVSLELPQQPNAYDCGLFLLHYVERFLEEAPINFCPLKITSYSKFLNTDWFRSEEPFLKRAHIQRLIFEILEGESSPTACSGKPCAVDCPENISASDNNFEIISEGCSPSESVHCKIYGSQTREGIEVSRLQTSASQHGGNSSLVLREFLETGDTAGSFINGQYQTFNPAAVFGTVGHMEDNVEACGYFVSTRSNVNLDYGFPCLSNDFEADPHKARHGHFEEYPETSISGSEVEILENNSSEKEFIIEEKTYDARSPLIESAPNQMLDVAEIQSFDRILSNPGCADNGLKPFKFPKSILQQGCNSQDNGCVTCVEIDVVRSASETDEQQYSETIDGMPDLERSKNCFANERNDLVSETVLQDLEQTDGMLELERIGNDSFGNERNDFVSQKVSQELISETVSQNLITDGVLDLERISEDQDDLVPVTVSLELVSVTDGVLDLEKIDKDFIRDGLVSKTVSQDLVSQPVGVLDLERIDKDSIGKERNNLILETVSQDLVSEPNRVLDVEWFGKDSFGSDLIPGTVAQALVGKTDGLLDLGRIDKDTFGDDLVLESDGQLVANRTDDELLPESDERLPAKRPRLDCTLSC